METSTHALTKEVTRTFFGSDEGYQALERHWSALVNSPVKTTLGPDHHLLYQALRGKDWRKAFAPITNESKRKNGAFQDWGLVHALRRLHADSAQEKLLAPFFALIATGVLNDGVLQKVRTVLPRRVSGFEVTHAYEVICDE